MVFLINLTPSKVGMPKETQGIEREWEILEGAGNPVQKRNKP